MESAAANTAAEMAGTPAAENPAEAPASETPAADAQPLTSTEPAAAPDARASAWAEQRPAEEAISSGVAAEAGKTIVEINFKGGDGGCGTRRPHDACRR